MYLLKPMKEVIVITLALFLFSCGNSGNSETVSQSEAKNSNKILSSQCDKIIKDYDDLVTKVIQLTRDRMNGKEIDKAEEEQLKKESEELGNRIMKLGHVGLGGQHCYQEFLDIQMKWTDLAVELQQEALKKAMENME